MNVRTGSIDEFMKLWNYSGSTTYEYFLQQIKSNNVEFWTVEIETRLIAELYIFWNSEDSEEANGLNRAYLCAFRVKREYQNKGVGSLLLSKVIERIHEKGFSEITIGIDNSEYDKLKSLYAKFGFDCLIKKTNIDLHYFDENNDPVIYNEPYLIMLNKR